MYFVLRDNGLPLSLFYAIIQNIKRRILYEKNIKNNYKKEESEQEITQIMESLTMVEMFALEDYIVSKNLLDKL